MPRHLQVYQHTAHTSCVVSALERSLTSSPAAAAPLPRRLLLSCTCGNGKILSYSSSNTEAKIFTESICQTLCSYTKHPGWDKLSFTWLRWDVSRTKVSFNRNLENTQSYVLTLMLLIYLPLKAVSLLSSYPCRKIHSHLQSTPSELGNCHHKVNNRRNSGKCFLRKAFICILDFRCMPQYHWYQSTHLKLSVWKSVRCEHKGMLKGISKTRVILLMSE